MKLKMFLTSFCLLVFIVYCWAACDLPHFSKCTCGEMEFNDKMQYVLKCVDTGFTNASILAHLPSEIQVLIFTGNNIPELPWNVFGTTNNYSELRVVDMSNNNIQEIRGKTYHRVPKVERLILNHNQISISSSKGTKHHHPRVFSNFESLVELHLTNAFADNSSEELAADLHDIFINSDLTKLRKLHLEQNEISHFKDPRLFCELNDLMDLHLSNNQLTSIDFEVDCLKHLRFIDLEANAIEALKQRDFSLLDALPARNQNLTIDLSDNPFSCGCEIQQLYSWLQSTSVVVRNKNKLRCKHSPSEKNNLSQQGPLLMKLQHLYCPPLDRTLTATAPQTCQLQSSNTVAFLALSLFATLSLLVYTNRIPLQNKFWPLMMTLRRKVHYTTIGKQDAQEMDV